MRYLTYYLLVVSFYITLHTACQTDQLTDKHTDKQMNKQILKLHPLSLSVTIRVSCSGRKNPIRILKTIQFLIFSHTNSQLISKENGSSR